MMQVPIFKQKHKTNSSTICYIYSTIVTFSVFYKLYTKQLLGVVNILRRLFQNQKFDVGCQGGGITVQTKHFSIVISRRLLCSLKIADMLHIGTSFKLEKGKSMLPQKKNWNFEFFASTKLNFEVEYRFSIKYFGPFFLFVLCR